MKNLFKIVGVLFILLIIAAIVIPFLYQDEITELVKRSTNESIDATVNFTDVDISLLSNFPDLLVSVNDLSVINKAPFEGDTLFYAKSLDISLDFLSLFSSEVLKIKSVDINEPKILVSILEDETANYTVTKENSENPKESNAKFKVSLQSYSLTNGKIIYIDKSTNIVMTLLNVNHTGEGDFTQDNFILDTKTMVEKLTYEFGGVKYLNKVKANLEMELAVNLPLFKFEFRNNELMLNNLPIKFDGWMSMPDEDILMDFNFNSPSRDFKNIISLIPAIYKNNFNDIESSGKIKLSGNVKGELSDIKIPTFDILLNVQNGKFKYPDLPISINNVNLTCNVTNSDGIKDHTIIDLNKFHLELGEDSFDAKLRITNPTSSPNIDTKIVGIIDFENIRNALKLNDISKLEGIVQSNITAKGNIATMQSNYEKINADGEFLVSNFVFLSKDFSDEIHISDAGLYFSPRNTKLGNFNAKIGESDISATGSLNNLISYVLSDGVLIGNLNLSSNYFNFNPFITEDSQSKNDAKENELTAFNIPENINLKMTSNFKKILYDDLELTNATGQINVKNGKVSLINLKMNLLNGSLTGSGYYAKTDEQENPEIDFNLSVKDFNIGDTYKKFVSVQQIAPIAKFIQGSFSSNLKLTSSLDSSLMPIWETFFGNGFLKIGTAEIKNFKPFTTVGSLLSLDELSNPIVKNLNPKFKIENGRFSISPAKYKVGKYDVVLSGSNGIDQSLDYVVEIDVPAGTVKNQANKSISKLLGANVDLVNVNSVKVKALIGGTIDNSTVKTSVGDVVKDVVSDVVTKVKDKVVDEATAKTDELKAKAKEKADAIKVEAQAKADKLKADAEKRMKEEKRKLEEAAKKKKEELQKKIEEEAKKKLKNIFGGG